MTDLTTDYLGLKLSSPIVASPSPITGHPESAKEVAAAGAGAIVLPSLFEEEILQEEMQLNDALDAGSGVFAEASEYFPDVKGYESVTDRYLKLVEETKASVDVPVVASLNAITSGGWVRYAKLVEEAGADALELNIYKVATDAGASSLRIEDEHIGLVREVSRVINIPLAVKLSPFYSSMASFVPRVVEAGAKGVVLFNRFYQPDLNLDDLSVEPRLELSAAWELGVPMRWIAILRPHLLGKANIAATSGVHTGLDVAKALLVGADVAMTTSALLRKGPGHVSFMLDELRQWMAKNEYESVAQLRGSMSQQGADNPAAFERANYLKTIRSWAAPLKHTPFPRV